MIRRILPHPVLSLVCALVWILLVNRFAWGSLVFALVIGLIGCLEGMKVEGTAQSVGERTTSR